jgi:hypothetical protein
MKKTILYLFALSVTSGFIYAIYKTIELIFDKINNLKPEVSVAIVAGCFTVFVSISSVLISKNYERKQQILRDQHSKKVAIYESFIELWFEILFADKIGKKTVLTDEKIFITKFMPIVTQMIPWASDDVIKSFVEFRDSSINDIDSSDKKHSVSIKVFHKFESLLLNIRKDLGHSCKNIKSGDLIRIFINDYDKVLKESAK